jgi:hypothetical protein
MTAKIIIVKLESLAISAAIQEFSNQQAVNPVDQPLLTDPAIHPWITAFSDECYRYVLNSFKSQFRDPIRWPICSEKRVRGIIKAGKGVSPQVHRSLLPTATAQANRESREGIEEQRRIACETAQRKKDIIANEKQALIALRDQLVISGEASLSQIQLVLDQETVHFADQSDRVLGLWNALKSVRLRLLDHTANDLTCLSTVSKLDAIEKKLICSARGWAYQWATDETKRIANLLSSAFQPQTFLLNSRAEPDTRSVAVANIGDGGSFQEEIAALQS